MKIWVLMGIGMALIILPGFSMGMYHTGPGGWPPFSDPRWIPMGVGLFCLVAARVWHARELEDRD